MYGMASPSGARIVGSLNDPKAALNETEKHARNHFWLNPAMGNQPYDPEKPGYAETKCIGSPIHQLLDAEPTVARLTGRTRKEVSRFYGDGKKEIECVEVEITMPETGLLNQCYYCLAWEAEGPMERWKSCGDDTFWCPSCQARGAAMSSLSGTLEKLTRDTFLPLVHKETYARDSLYSYS